MQESAPDNSGDISSYDIVIVGAGITGAAMALSLADSGLRLALIDRQPVTGQLTATELTATELTATKLTDSQVPGAQTSSPAIASGAHDFDPRVSAITAASRQLFESLALWPAITAQRVSAYTGMHVREADGTGSIDFAAADIHARELGHIIENRVMINAMHDQLAQQADLDLLAPARLLACEQTHSAALLTLEDGRQISAALVIAADGANSALREMAGFRTREWDYEHHALVASICTEQPHGQIARQIFMDEGVLAFLPLNAQGDDAGHYCSIVWSVVPQRAQALMTLSDEEFCRQLGLASQHWLGAVGQCSQRSAFPLRQRHATDYFKERVVLIGDAAHSIHPLAGQGANLGLSDVRVLSQELRAGVQARRSLDDPLVLARYQRRRKGENLAMMALMEGFKRLYGPQPLAVRWLRNTGMRLVDHWPLLKNQLVREAMGRV
jgi:2-polyprenylphenol 6-hydroxylase